MNSKNIIELNGNRYDALSGALLGPAPVKPQATPAQAVHSRTVKNVDGILSTSQTRSSLTVAKPKPVVPPTRHIKVTIANANHTKAHSPQTAQTLMRTSVQKPGESFKKQITVQSALHTKVPSLITKKPSVYSITPSRISKAKSVPRSPHISRYGETSHTNIAVSVAPLAVQAPPTKPMAALAPDHDNRPVPNIFEQAVANATNFVDTTAHKAQFQKKARRHVVSMAGGSLVLLLLAGFIAYQHTPVLQLKVAAYEAGFGVQIPNYKAAGFSWAGVQSQSGKLTVGLKGEQGSTYQLSQQPTNWTSEEMIQNTSSVDASGNPNYATLQAGNLTVYRYSNSSATWIKNGTWYQLTSASALSNAQVEALAQNS